MKDFFGSIVILLDCTIVGIINVIMLPFRLLSRRLTHHDKIVDDDMIGDPTKDIIGANYDFAYYTFGRKAEVHAKNYIRSVLASESFGMDLSSGKSKVLYNIYYFLTKYVLLTLNLGRNF